MTNCAYPQHMQANTYNGGNSGAGDGHPNFCDQRLFFAAAQTMRFFVLSRNVSRIQKVHIWSEFPLNAGTRQNANRGVRMETLRSTTRSLQTTDLNLPRTCWVNACLLRRPVSHGVGCERYTCRYPFVDDRRSTSTTTVVSAGSG